MKLLDIHACTEINGKAIPWKQNWKRLLGKNVKEKEKNQNQNFRFLIFTANLYCTLIIERYAQKFTW